MNQIIFFSVMFLIGVILNPMNILANKVTDIYLSLTLIYSALLMASNMIWSHQLINYLNTKRINYIILFTGISMSLFFIFLLRNQIGVSTEQWLKRMIGHHSTALTTTKKLLDTPNNFYDDPKIYRLAKDIVYNQEREILFMKGFLKSNYLA
jgi:hypothetical protein